MVLWVKFINDEFINILNKLILIMIDKIFFDITNDNRINFLTIRCATKWGKN
jgi:hypothetical protein